MESDTNPLPDEDVGKNLKLKSDPDGRYRLLGGAAILGISGLSAIIAGVVTSHVAKKKNKELLKELGKEVPHVPLESPYSLAFRALAWGTVWAVGGCSLIIFGIWKWYGLKDMNDLRTRLRSRIKKSSGDDETEFENLRQLLEYLNETSKVDKKKTKGT